MYLAKPGDYADTGGNMGIRDLLGIKNGDLVVAVGGGGKTTLLETLAIELAGAGFRTIVTTTTKIYPHAEFPHQLITGDNLEEFHRCLQEINWERTPILGKEINCAGKLVGLDPEWVDAIKEWSLSDVILVEGDGARRKPFKAPRRHEPVIPGKATLVIPVAGMDCLDMPLTEENFPGLEEMLEITGLRYGDSMTVEGVAQVLLSEQGYKKGVPPSARWIPLLNKVEDEAAGKNARQIAGLLHLWGVNAVLIGSLKSHNLEKIEFPLN